MASFDVDDVDQVGEAQLREIASLCSRAIYRWAGHEGFAPDDLARRLPSFHSLGAAARFRVCVLLARSEFLAVSGEHGAWRFWARHCAPEGAYAGQKKREAL